MDDNKIKNLTILSLSVTIVALVGMQVYNSIVLDDIRNNVANSKTVIVKTENNVLKTKTMKNEDFDKISISEPVFGSKEYFEQINKKQEKSRLKTEYGTSSMNSLVPQKLSAVPPKSTVFTVPKPVAKTRENNSTQLPVGKVLKPSPYLSPSTNQNSSTGSVAKSNTSTNNAGIDTLREPDFGPYMRNLQRSVKMNWNPPKGNESQKVVTSFRIAKDGSLLGANIKQSSGNKATDEAALNAVKTTKFNPLPKDCQKDYIDIQFTFDYNVFSAVKK